MASSARIAVVGAGLGGATAASLFARAGFDVRVYEQAQRLARLGAGIHVGPNAMRVMREIGIDLALERISARPNAFISRDGVTGELLANIRLGDHAVERYGARYLTVHRGDFHGLIVDTVPAGIISFGKQLVDVAEAPDEVVLSFADGTSERADIVIGADGINSRLREHLLGPEAPTFTGMIAHRAILDSRKVPKDVERCCKWWSGKLHLMFYALGPEEFYFVTGVPEAEWDMRLSEVPSDQADLRRSFGTWHETVQQLIDAATTVSKWPLLDRRPLPLWSRGRIVLLGDACHPMKPHMAQGAAMAIEDAVILKRCLELHGTGNYQAAFAMYEANRAERATRVQLVSRQGDWLRTDEDPAWCFGYDAIEVPLVAAHEASQFGGPSLPGSLILDSK
ncbi:MAG: FAD-dependent monooxygenase [Pseudorhodoplanes sp.]|uniref:FAD-dependent monooxygenase n=1 Tax=Pseudorhodoplanes sp. TaxID=1934341 RepID=UPI003D132312